MATYIYIYIYIYIHTLQGVDGGGYEIKVHMGIWL